MQKLIVVLSLVASLFISAGVRAECSEPQDVAMPDGETASTEEMVAGQKAVKQYVADGQAFLDCMTELETKTADTASEEEKKNNVVRYNTVVDKMQAAAEGFNAQIKAYKTAQAKK